MSYESSFWDTVKGHRLADTLIQVLPDLIPKKTMQFARIYAIDRLAYSFESATNAINEECESVERVVSTTAIDKYQLLVVYEKEIEGGIRQ